MKHDQYQRHWETVQKRKKNDEAEVAKYTVKTINQLAESLNQISQE